MNTVIKEKIKTFDGCFSDEALVIDHFWRAKFSYSKADKQIQESPEKHLKVPIEAFNQAFYRFFAKDVKLL